LEEKAIYYFDLHLSLYVDDIILLAPSNEKLIIF